MYGTYVSGDCKRNRRAPPPEPILVDEHHHNDDDYDDIEHHSDDGRIVPKKPSSRPSPSTLVVTLPSQGAVSSQRATQPPSVMSSSSYTYGQPVTSAENKNKNTGASPIENANAKDTKTKKAWIGVLVAVLVVLVVVIAIAIPLANKSSNEVLVPFDLAKFQPALNTSRLQYPESSPAAVNAGQFAGYSSDGFQLVDDRYIQFHIRSSEGARSELRHNPQFAASDAAQRSIQARMKIPQPDASLVSQFTFLQVHSKDFLGNPSGPLLRVVWIDSRSGNTDWLWANIRTSLTPKSNEYFPLQARPSDFFDIEVRVVNSALSILMDGSYPNPVYNAYKLSYWDAIQTNYFKAGVYLNYNSTGPVVTLFDELTFTV